MLYTKKALQMGAIAVGLAAFAGQSSLAESAKKEDSKPSVRTETMQVMPELTMASHFVGVPVPTGLECPFPSSIRKNSRRRALKP